MAEQKIVKGVANMKPLGYNPYTHIKDGQPLPRLMCQKRATEPTKRGPLCQCQEHRVNKQKENHSANADKSS